MVARISLVFVVAFLAFQVLTWQEASTSIIRREAPAAPTEDPTKTFDDTLNNFKSSLDDLIKNVQENQLFQNVSTSLKQFGETIQHQGKQLVDKISTSTKTN